MSSRRNKTSGLSGFVSFMKRRDAEEALRELDGFDWGGSVLRVGWSKAVPVGSRPLYSESGLLLILGKSRIDSCFSVANPAADDRDSRSRSRSHDRGRDKEGDRERSRSRSRQGGKHKNRRSRSRSYSSSRSRTPRRRDHRDRDHGGGHYRRRSRSYSRSRSPRRDRNKGHSRDADEKKLLGDDEVTDEFIRMVVVEVKSRGEEYEAALKEREKGNSKYLFLADQKVWSLA